MDPGVPSGRLMTGDWNGFLSAAFAASTRLRLAAGVDMVDMIFVDWAT